MVRSVAMGPSAEPDPAEWPVVERAAQVAAEAGADVGCAVAARADASRTVLRVAVTVAGDTEPSVMDLRLFQHGPHGLFRAAVATAAFLIDVLEGRSAGSGR